MMATDPSKMQSPANLISYANNDNPNNLEPFLSQIRIDHPNEDKNSIPQAEDDYQSLSESSSFSYEQDILDDHQNALHRLIHLHRNLFFIEGQVGYKVDLESYINGELKMCTFQEQLKTLLYKLSCSRPETVLKFKSFLERNRTFEMLLCHIHYVYEDEISIQLLNLAFLVWQHYFSYLKMALSSSEVDHVSKAIAQKLSKTKNIWNQLKEDANLQESKSRFIQGFTQTIVLVMQGFFHNQYSSRSDRSIKRNRPLSEENECFDQLGSNGMKRIKTEIAE